MGRSFTKFTYAPDGTAVYKSTGKRMPATYEIKGSNVYSKGRKVGTISKHQTAAERARVESAAKSRQKAKRAQARRMQQGKPSKPRKPRQQKPSQTQQRKPVVIDERNTDFPEPSQAAKMLLAERVRKAALSIATKWMVNYIQRMDPEILWTMYENGDVVLEIYFEYYENEPEGSKKPDYARLFIKRYQAYAGVEHGL